MTLYAGLDLHANNTYLAVIDDVDEVVASRRCPNDLETIRQGLGRFQEDLGGIAVESTFNWYWLIDGLKDSGFTVHLVNTLAAQQY